MSVETAQIKVKGGAPTKLEVPEEETGNIESGGRYYLRNDSAVDVFIGGPTVTVANGFRVPKESTLPFEMVMLARKESLWAVTSGGEGVLHLLRF